MSVATSGGPSSSITPAELIVTMSLVAVTFPTLTSPLVVVIRVTVLLVPPAVTVAAFIVPPTASMTMLPEPVVAEVTFNPPATSRMLIDRSPVFVVDAVSELVASISNFPAAPGVPMPAEPVSVMFAATTAAMPFEGACSVIVPSEAVVIVT